MRTQLISLSLIALFGCQARGETTPPAPTKQAPAIIKEAPLSLQKQSKGIGAPYYSSGEAAHAIAQLSSDPKGASTTLLNLSKKATGEEKLRLRFLAAIAMSRAGLHRDAAPIFEELADSYPLLASYSISFGAESYALLKDAKKVADLTAKAPEGQVASKLALRVRAETLDTNKSPDAEEAIVKYLGTTTRAPQGDKWNSRLATIRLEKKDLEGAAKAYRAILAGWPLGSLAQTAQDELTKLSAQLGEKKTALSAEERLRRANVFLDAQTHKEAEAAFNHTIDVAEKGSAVLCQAKFYKARSIYKQRNQNRAGDAFVEAATSCKGVDDKLRRDSLYNAGKSYKEGDSCDKAISYYQKTEDEFPKETLADDARVHRGECLFEKKDPRAEEVLLSVAADFPEGDMAEESLWGLSWSAYQDNDLKRAAKFLAQGAALKKVTNFWAEGRSGYWLGRVREKQKNKEAAIAAYVDVLAVYPITYYARLATLRLRELDPKAAAAGQLAPATKVADDAVPDPLATAVSKEGAFQRGLELLKLGLIDYAREEFSTLSADDPETLWVLAELYDEVGAYPLSHNIPRRKIASFRFEPPTSSPLALRRWQIAYPAAFDALILEWSKKNNNPAALSFAIMREESSFDPRIESHSHAVGLLQLLVPTGKMYGKKLKLTQEITAEALRDPETNIKLGTTFLGESMGKYDRNAAFSAAAYNAGPGAVAKWKKAFGNIPLDEFVERIPYDETRNYTKRVMTSYEIYSYLYELPNEELPLTWK
jgi:soluble lytic murein transglycosylase